MALRVETSLSIIEISWNFSIAMSDDGSRSLVSCCTGIDVKVPTFLLETGVISSLRVQRDATRVAVETFLVDVIGGKWLRSMVLCSENVGVCGVSASISGFGFMLSMAVLEMEENATGLTFDVFSVDILVVEDDICVEFPSRKLSNPQW